MSVRVQLRERSGGEQQHGSAGVTGAQLVVPAIEGVERVDEAGPVGVFLVGQRDEPDELVGGTRGVLELRGVAGGIRSRQHGQRLAGLAVDDC